MDICVLHFAEGKLMKWGTRPVQANRGGKKLPVGRSSGLRQFRNMLPPPESIAEPSSKSATSRFLRCDACEPLPFPNVHALQYHLLLRSIHPLATL